MTRGFPQPGGRHGDDGLKIGRTGMKPIKDFIKIAKKDKNLTSFGTPFSSTYSHNPPKRLLKKYTKDGRSIHIAKYYAMCDWFDETCGDLLNIVDENGDRDNTLVIYVTDNGWIQNPNRGGYDARSKQTPYEGGIRTQLCSDGPQKLNLKSVKN